MLNNGMLKGRLMNGVKIKKSELLDALRKNLQQHKTDVLDALRLRRLEVDAQLSDVMDKIKRDENYQPQRSFSFPIPEDNSREYEKVIRMVEMTQDDVIELDEDQFDKLVMDNWSFKHELMQTSSFYRKDI
jgi:hypothetical protein